MCAGQWLGKRTKQGMQSEALPHHVPTKQTVETQETPSYQPRLQGDRTRSDRQTDRETIVCPLLTEICISST